jgi:hypothetical protein
MRSTHGQLKARKICDQLNFAHYRATDEALRLVAQECDACTHVVVTNGDNGYAPNFLKETLKRAEQVVLTDFVHDGGGSAATLELGGLDLGGVVFVKVVLQGGEHTLLSSLPKDATALDVHNADYWFVKKAVERGASYAVVHKISMD